ncbi:MAG: signal peptide peptidase SppA [Gammaproteobacteria bacterium]|nr:signal peptide peptidase SppA [Gammaproteobacteria bacterium]
MSRSNPIIRILQWFWRGLNVLRRVLHLILLLAIFGLLVAGLAGTPVTVPDGAALVLDPEGELVEQLAGDPLTRALGELQGDGVRQVLVQDLVDAIDAAAQDARIEAIVLRLERLEANGLPKLQAVTAAMARARTAGKKLIALGDAYDQAQYYVAAQADEVYLNDLGLVFIDGFGYYRTFFKGALDKLHVDLNVFRVGEYKSFVEPFIRDDMSEEDRVASGKWLQGMWQVYQRDVVAARKLEPGSLDAYANDFAAHLQTAGGSASRVAVDRGLVDELMSRQEFRDHMVALVGEGDETGYYDYNAIDWRSYLSAVRRASPPQLGGDRIGVIVAAGQIVDGEAAAGEIGGDTLAGVVRQAALDEGIRAVVLRVDSPGGSMFASEVVRAELESLKAAGKPLVVSMGSLAASGGYYISMPADQIWASEATITGSIGVGALVPTVDRGLDALGIHVDGIGTTSLSGQMRLDRPLGAQARSILEQSVQDAYRIFVGHVAEARDMEHGQVDEVARGRVWIGADARDLGLVDAIGDLPAAVAAAAELAGLAEGSYAIEQVEPELSLPEQILRTYGVQLLGNLSRAGLRWPMAVEAPTVRLMRSLESRWQAVSALNDPRGLYYLCACDMP